MEQNLCAKFGPPPRLHAPPPRDVILPLQFAVCAVLLVIISPPFVMAPALCPKRVVAISLMTTCATMVMHKCGTRPIDLLTESSRAFYRATI